MVFFSPKLLNRLVGDLPQEDTAKVGQRQKRAVENLGFPYEVATYCNLLFKDGDLKKILVMVRLLGPIIFHKEKNLCSF
jgi:hypothetical protein